MIDVPLFDNELSFICQNSDHSSTNRILVQPKSGHYTTYCIDGTKYRDFAPTHKRYALYRPIIVIITTLVERQPIIQLILPCQIIITKKI